MLFVGICHLCIKNSMLFLTEMEPDQTECSHFAVYQNTARTGNVGWALRQKGRGTEKVQITNA